MAHQINLKSGDYVQISNIRKGIFRIRLECKAKFTNSLMECFDILDLSSDKVETIQKEDEHFYSIKTGEYRIVLDREKERFYLERDNNIITDLSMYCLNDNGGSGANFKLDNEEKFYGLGYRKGKNIQLRGEAYRNHVAYGQSYGPIPFVMSSKGWAVYFNTTCDSYFDIASTENDAMHIWCEQNSVDIFLMLGDSYRDLIGKFTQITGRPTLMPLWGYGFMFICNEKENQFDILNDAAHFMDKKIPCDMLGLEPGWMSKYYDDSLEKDWDSEKFYMPWWSDDRKIFKDVTFIGALKRYGFKLSLWLCCDYDIYAEEVRREKLVCPESNNTIHEKPFEFGKLDFDAEAHKPIYMDTKTKTEIPWFDHLKKFIDSGVVAFKQDPAYVVNDHPDRLYANGMTDKELHNIYSTVLAKQVHEGYRKYTNTRSMYFLGTAFTGIQRWEPTWTCDSGGRDDVLIGILQYGLCGHMNVTCDMDVHTADGIHFGFLLPWSLANSWAAIEHPWWLGPELSEIFTYYANLHYSLMPYIYSYAFEGHLTGMPIVRAMNLMYENDAECDNLTHQYMLGDNLLVGAFIDSIYLPEGKWIDYWSGKVCDGQKTIKCTWPEDKGGALFIRMGAIIPRWTFVQSSDIKNNKNLILEYYEGENSTFTLYEDDGIGYDYEDNKFSKTNISFENNKDMINLTFNTENIEYSGFDEKRYIAVIIKGVGQKRPVRFNGQIVNGKTSVDNCTVVVSFEKY